MISKSSSTNVTVSPKSSDESYMSYWPVNINFDDFCCFWPIP